MLGAIQHNGMNNSYTEFGKEDRQMPSDVLSDGEREIARCQSERPDIYDAHYAAIEQLKAAYIVHARARVLPSPTFHDSE